MNEQDTRPRKWIAAIGMAFVGGVYAVAVFVMALLCTGAGHGWMSGYISGCGIPLVPLAGIAWVYRGTLGGRALAGVTLILAFMVDCYLLITTQNEGFGYFWKAFSAMPVFMLVARPVAGLAACPPVFPFSRHVQLEARAPWLSRGGMSSSHRPGFVRLEVDDGERGRVTIRL